MIMFTIEELRGILELIMRTPISGKEAQGTTFLIQKISSIILKEESKPTKEK